MPIIRITQADKLVAKTMEAGWATCVISEIEQKASKSGNSVNLWTTFQISQGPMAGKEVRVSFNTEVTSPSLLGNLYILPIGKFSEVVAAIEGRTHPIDGDESVDTDSLLQRPLDVNFGVDISEGNPANTVQGFAPAGVGKNMQRPF